MKDMNLAERMIWRAAQDLVSAKRSRNEFTSVDYAMGQFYAFCEMAIKMNQTTAVRIEQIKKMAKEKIY